MSGYRNALPSELKPGATVYRANGLVKMRVLTNVYRDIHSEPVVIVHEVDDLFAPEVAEPTRLLLVEKEAPVYQSLWLDDKGALILGPRSENKMHTPPNATILFWKRLAIFEIDGLSAQMIPIA